MNMMRLQNISEYRIILFRVETIICRIGSPIKLSFFFGPEGVFCIFVRFKKRRRKKERVLMLNLEN